MGLIKVSDFIAKRLVFHGVKHVFMVSGGGAMHLNDSFGHCEGLEYITNHHEQASAIAAEGYARVNQCLVAVNVTTGPGGINALNGVFGQWTDSVPVIYISGQVKRQTTIASCDGIGLRQLGDQEVDIISIVKPIVKYAETILDPMQAKYIIDQAVYVATHNRKGPVWVDVPIDVQAAKIEEDELVKFFPETEDNIFNEDVISDFRQLLLQSERPLIVAGHGIRLAGAISLFKKSMNKLNIPVVTTMNGFDLVENSEELFVGRIGTVGQRAGNFALQNADLVICLGTRNNIRQVSYNWENFAKNAKVIVVDIDQSELKKPTVNIDLAINMDVGLFLGHLLNKGINDLNIKRQDWLGWCKEIRNKFDPEKNNNYTISKEHINPYLFVIELTKSLDEGSILVGGNGSAFLCPFQAGIVKKNQRYIWNSGNASMGYDLPAAIGSCVANNRQEIICLTGDGSIMMNIQELQTIRHYNFPIKIFLLNNDGYISIQQTQTHFFDSQFVACTRDSGVTLPDFSKLVRSFDLEYIKIDNDKELRNDIKKILDMNGPVVCEVFLDRGYIFNPKLSSKKLDDGTMVSPSLEDMYPFLSREEFLENMVVKPFDD